MKTLTLLLSLAALPVLTASTQVDIPILNPTFDLDQLTCSPSGACYTTGISGWLSGPYTYLFKGSSSQFKDASAEGLYVADIGSATGTGSIFQTLGSVLEANTTYVLRVRIGARADYSFTGYLAGLGAGNVTLATGNSATPVGGEFVTEEIIYNSGVAPAQLGKPLQVFVKSVGSGSASGSADVAAVTLTAKAN